MDEQVTFMPIVMATLVPGPQVGKRLIRGGRPSGYMAVVKVPSSNCLVNLDLLSACLILFRKKTGSGHLHLQEGCE